MAVSDISGCAHNPKMHVSILGKIVFLLFFSVLGVYISDHC